MGIGILGTKLGMTQIFDQEAGVAIPVTVIQAGPCVVTQLKTKDSDGYNSVQVGYGNTKDKALTKPLLGHLRKSNAAALRHMQEFRVDEVSEYQLGSEVKPSIFSIGDLVDVTGVSIGRGFAGYQKRHNFRRGNMTHGSKNHRLPGSTGAGTTPGRVYPGKRMAGQYGAKKTTIRKLSVVEVDSEQNVLVVKGSVPGKPGALLRINASNIVGK